MKKPLTEEEKKVLGIITTDDKNHNKPSFRRPDPISRNEFLFINGIPSHSEIKTTEELKVEGIIGSKQKVYVGVDPGINGGISFVDDVGNFNRWTVPRLASGEADIPELFRIVKSITDRYDPVFIIEDVHALFGVGASTTFQFGFIVGVLRAVIYSTGKRVEFVQPKQWQSVVWSNIDKVYKPKKPNQKKAQVDTKQTSLMAAIRLFPGFKFSDPNKPRANKPHDGIFDSLLIAEYGRRLNL